MVVVVMGVVVIVGMTVHEIAMAVLVVVMVAGGGAERSAEGVEGCRDLGPCAVETRRQRLDHTREGGVAGKRGTMMADLGGVLVHVGEMVGEVAAEPLDGVVTGHGEPFA